MEPRFLTSFRRHLHSPCRRNAMSFSIQGVCTPFCGKVTPCFSSSDSSRSSFPPSQEGKLSYFPSSSFLRLQSGHTSSSCLSLSSLRNQRHFQSPSLEKSTSHPITTSCPVLSYRLTSTSNRLPLTCHLCETPVCLERKNRQVHTVFTILQRAVAYPNQRASVGIVDAHTLSSHWEKKFTGRSSFLSPPCSHFHRPAKRFYISLSRSRLERAEQRGGKHRQEGEEDGNARHADVDKSPSVYDLGKGESSPSVTDTIRELSQSGTFPSLSQTDDAVGRAGRRETISLQAEREAARREARRRRRRVLGVFSVCACLPVILAAVGFQAVIQAKQGERQEALDAFTDVQSILEAAADVVGGSGMCFCLTSGEDGNITTSVVAHPHLPEAALLRLPEKPVVEGVNSPLLNTLMAERSHFSLPFNFIHFAVDRSGQFYQAFSGGDAKKKASDSGKPGNSMAPSNTQKRHSNISLLYVQPSSRASLTLSGIAAPVTSPDYRRHYWRNSWRLIAPDSNDKEYVLMKFVPTSLQLRLPAAEGRLAREGITLRRVVSDDDIKWTREQLPSPEPVKVKSVV